MHTNQLQLNKLHGFFSNTQRPRKLLQSRFHNSQKHAGKSPNYQFTKCQNLGLVCTKAFADDQIKYFNGTEKKIKLDYGKVENVVGKRRKCWLPAFSPFAIIFSKAIKC